MTDIFKDGLWRGEIYESELYIQDRVLLLTPSEVQQLFDAFLSKMIEETDLRMWPNRHLDKEVKS